MLNVFDQDAKRSDKLKMVKYIHQSRDNNGNHNKEQNKLRGDGFIDDDILLCNIDRFEVIGFRCRRPGFSLSVSDYMLLVKT